MLLRVRLDGVQGDEQRVADLALRQLAGQQPQHRQLAIGQVGDGVSAAAAPRATRGAGAARCGRASRAGSRGPGSARSRGGRLDAARGRSGVARELVGARVGEVRVGDLDDRDAALRHGDRAGDRLGALGDPPALPERAPAHDARQGRGPVLGQAALVGERQRAGGDRVAGRAMSPFSARIAARPPEAWMTARWFPPARAVPTAASSSAAASPARPLQNSAMPRTGQPTGRHGVLPRRTDRVPASTARPTSPLMYRWISWRLATPDSSSRASEPARSAASIQPATSSRRPVFTAIHALVRHRLASPRTASSPSASSHPATVSIRPRCRYAYQCSAMSSLAPATSPPAIACGWRRRRRRRRGTSPPRGGGASPRDRAACAPAHGAAARRRDGDSGTTRAWRPGAARAARRARGHRGAPSRPCVSVTWSHKGPHSRSRIEVSSRKSRTSGVWPSRTS